MKLPEEPTRPARVYGLDQSRLFAARLALHQFRTLPFQRLKYRNLREDFYENGIIPLSYFSYCCSQKAPFRQPGSLTETLAFMCAMDELNMLRNEGAADMFGLKIDPKSTLFMEGSMAEGAYKKSLKNMTAWDTQFNVPVNYPVHRLVKEAKEAEGCRTTEHW
ncbi:MAG: hypothetical protein CSA72_09710 [Rhodobacterales bacterium]|nr:MAG: hypothetical protein CSA72_09710 [Rhodobacterales bacterium]